MKKYQALALLPGIDKTGIHFSNINASKDVWWLDIPISKIQSPSHPLLTLVLHDHRVAKLHVLDVPTAFLLENFESLSIREDKDMVSLELSSEESRFLENVRPQTSGLCFASFLVNSVSVV